MDDSEKKYFERMCDHKAPKIKTPYSESKKDIIYFSNEIRKFAQETINGKLSATKARKEISDLLNLIKELNIDEIR